jgi:platelet-activating factor acetylhydrolase
MSPVLLLQYLRYYVLQEASGWVTFIKVTCVFLILLSAVLTLLFPAVKLSQPKGEYNVGVVDLYLPVEFDDTDDKVKSAKGHVKARLFYPTLEEVDEIPYFNEDVANHICGQMMAVNGLDSLKWFFYHWKLMTLRVKRNAKPVSFVTNEVLASKKRGSEKPLDSKAEQKIPMAVFSHGILGNVFIYSYQCMNLASNGTLVLLVEHTDGSAIGAKKKDGSFVYYDLSIAKLDKDPDYFKNVDYIRARRNQIQFRAQEFVAASKAFRSLNETNIRELEDLGISFIGKLNTDDLSACGHSFGGATALVACKENPSLYSCYVGHDPAVDWMPDDARYALFEESQSQSGGSRMKYDGGTGGYEKTFQVPTQKTLDEQSLHGLDLFFLFSHEWVIKGYANIPFIQNMLRRGKLGLWDGESTVDIIHNACHVEFSDSCMKTPIWLARAGGMTGSRNPHETAEEIASRTLDFLSEVRGKRNVSPKNVLQ